MIDRIARLVDGNGSPFDFLWEWGQNTRTPHRPKKELKLLRSIKKAHEIIKEKDNETAVTLYTIRHWCKEGKIKYLTVGNKILIDIESLLDYIEMK